MGLHYKNPALRDARPAGVDGPEDATRGEPGHLVSARMGLGVEPVRNLRGLESSREVLATFGCLVVSPDGKRFLVATGRHRRSIAGQLNWHHSAAHSDHTQHRSSERYSGNCADRRVCRSAE